MKITTKEIGKMKGHESVRGTRLKAKVEILTLSDQAFWDIDMDSLKGNESLYADWIIKRIAQYGTFEDIVNLAEYYGEARLQEAFQKMTESEKNQSRLFEMFYIL